MGLVEVTDLHIQFGGVVAVDNLTFTVKEGEILGLIGPNGAGKTTVFNCMSGLYRPQNGSFRFLDREMIGTPPHLIAKAGIARTFQNIELFDQRSCVENLMLGRHLHAKAGFWHGLTQWGPRSRAGREEIGHREKVHHIMETLDLHRWGDQAVGSLPYGIRKRIELGRVVACEPKLLLLDEPAAGMNDQERAAMFHHIEELRRQGITIMLIEHHMHMVMKHSNRVIALDFGKKIAEGSPEDVAQHPEVVRAYLGHGGEAPC